MECSLPSVLNCYRSFPFSKTLRAGEKQTAYMRPRSDWYVPTWHAPSLRIHIWSPTDSWHYRG